MNWISILADFVGIVSAVFAYRAWINTRRISAHQESEQKRLDQKVQIRLLHTQEDGAQLYIDLPGGKMRREELTRGEVLGWIGMLPMKEKGVRFSIPWLSNDEFLKTMNEIQAASGDALFVIPCSRDDLDQFKVEPKVLNSSNALLQPKTAQPAA